MASSQVSGPPEILSDEEMQTHMASAGVKGPPPDVLSDDEISKMQSNNISDAGQAGLEHFGNAAAMGYLPQMQAVTEPITDRIFNAISSNHVDPAPLKQMLAMGPGYVQSRDANIARLKEQEINHPVASTVGTIGGTLASAIPAGAGLAKIPGIAKLATMEAPEAASLAARGTALAGRTAASVLGAGAQGIVSNPGDVKGEVHPLQPEERLKSATLNAAVAAPLHLGGEAIESGGQWLADKLKDKAEKLSFRALGPFKRQVNQNRDDINEIGREALDSGIVRWRPTNAEGLEERAGTAASAAGKKLGDITDELIGLEKQAGNSGIARKDIADQLRDKLIVDNPAGIPAIDKRNTFYEGMIKDFEQDPTIKTLAAKMNVSYDDAAKVAARSGYQPKPMSFEDLRKAKMMVQGTKDQEGLINWNRLRGADIPQEEQFHRALASQLREGEEKGADAIEKAYYGQNSNRLQQAKEQFGNLEKASQIAGNKADAERANRILGLTDTIAGGAGASLGGYIGYKEGGYEGMKTGAELGGAIGAFGNKAMRTFGSQVGAKTADALSKVLEHSPDLNRVLQKYPNALPQLIRNLDSQRSSGAGTQSGNAPHEKPKTNIQPAQGQVPMSLDEARERAFGPQGGN